VKSVHSVGYRLDDIDLNPGMGKRFISAKNIQSDSKAHPVF